MTQDEKKVIEMTAYELITLLPRLPEPYRSNVEHCYKELKRILGDSK
jgi:hypothetical protein